MKKLSVILLTICIAFASCKKNTPFDPAAQAVADDAAIQAYLKANPSITATKDASGLYYQIITPGTGNNPTSSSTVTVNYTGKLLDGTTFDTTTGKASLNISLKSVIQGWTIGVPRIKPGGRILLIIPSGLAYGNNATGSIAANSVLIFTIDLISFN